MSLLNTHTHVITEQEYIQGELLSDIRHEYIDGCVYAMVGATKKHNIISGNIFYELKDRNKKNKASYDVFTSDMKVKVNQSTSNNNVRYFYPDVMLVCNKEDDTDDTDDQQAHF
jgi:Uma2 family endonuclease